LGATSGIDRRGIEAKALLTRINPIQSAERLSLDEIVWRDRSAAALIKTMILCKCPDPSLPVVSGVA